MCYIRLLSKDLERVVSYIPLINGNGEFQNFYLLDHIILEESESELEGDYYVVIFEGSKKTEVVKLIDGVRYQFISQQELEKLYEIFKQRCAELYEFAS